MVPLVPLQSADPQNGTCGEKKKEQGAAAATAQRTGHAGLRP